MAIVLCQDLNGQLRGATYNGPAEMVPWLLLEGYVKDTTSPVSHISTGAALPVNDPTLARNREDFNDKYGDADDFQFGTDSALAPRVESIEPATGAAAGSTALVISGDNFTDVLSVTIGGVATTAFSVKSDNEIRCTTGAHAAGAVNVVLDKTGSADTTVTNGFTYTA